MVARTEATGRTASASEGAIGPPGCDAPVDSAHERYCSARMHATAPQKPRIKPENTSCTMGAVSQKCSASQIGDDSGHSIPNSSRSVPKETDGLLSAVLPIANRHTLCDGDSLNRVYFPIRTDHAGATRLIGDG